jgi:hypothetical protein
MARGGGPPPPPRRRRQVVARLGALEESVAAMGAAEGAIAQARNARGDGGGDGVGGGGPAPAPSHAGNPYGRRPMGWLAELSGRAPACAQSLRRIEGALEAR